MSLLWEDSELRRFYQAFHRHANNWGKIVKALGHTKTEDDCEALWTRQKTLLSLQNNKIMEDAFVASVTDAQEAHETAQQQRMGTPRQQTEQHKASDSNHSGSTSSLQATAKRRRTPRVRKLDSIPGSGELGRGVRSSPAHAAAVTGTPGHTRKAPGTPTWPNGRSSLLQSPAGRTTPADPPTSAHKRKRHRKLFEDDVSPLRMGASAMSPERPASHNSSLQNGHKRSAQKWPHVPAGKKGPLEPHEDVGAADALLSLKAMPRAAPPLPPTSMPAAAVFPGQDMAEHLPRSGSKQQARPVPEEEGESPELKAMPGIPGTQRLQQPQRKNITLREPHRPAIMNMAMRAQSTDDFGPEPEYSTPPTASPSTSYPGMLHGDRWESMSGQQVTSAIKQLHHTMGSSVDAAGAHSVAGLSSDNNMITITVPPMHERHESAREVSSLAPDASTASEGAAPSSQLSGGPGPTSHEPLMSARHRFLLQPVLPHPFQFEAHQPHQAGTHSQHLPPLEHQRRAHTPVSASVARWPQQQLPSTAVPPPVLATRQRPRKPLPEKLPPMVPPLQKLLSKTSLAGAGSFTGLGGGSMGPSFAPQGMRQYITGETGDPVGPTEIMLRHSLSLKMRRWCMYEFLYSAIDRPYFMRNEWVEFLQSCGLAGTTRLTRSEWSFIRSGCFGKPRRLSPAFLKNERIRLEAYRETVRQLYEDTGGTDLPLNMPRPLHVGQAVTARHPTTRQIHDGVILTVANKGNKYRVQFNRAELMTEMIRDIEIMPVDPNENLPPANPAVNITLNGRLGAKSTVPARKKSSMTPGRGPAAGRAQQEARAAQVAADGAASEEDAKLTLEVQQLLNMKEALLGQLRLMNDQAQNSKDIRRSADFQKDYSTVMVNLGQVNEQLKGSLEKLLDKQPHLLGMMQPGASEPADGPSGSMLPPLHPAPSPIRSSPQVRLPMENMETPAPSTTISMQHLQGAPGSAGTTAEMPMWASSFSNVNARSIVTAAMQDARQVVSQSSLKRKDNSQDVERSAPSQATGPASTSGTDIPPTAVTSGPAATGQPQPQGQGAGASASSGAAGLQQLAKEPALGPDGAAVAGSVDNRRVWVEDLITGCVGMLFTVKQCTSNNVSVPTMEAALEMVLHNLKPRMPANMPVFIEIAAAVSTLKVQLANST